MQNEGSVQLMEVSIRHNSSHTPTHTRKNTGIRAKDRDGNAAARKLSDRIWQLAWPGEQTGSSDNPDEWRAAGQASESAMNGLETLHIYQARIQTGLYACLTGTKLLKTGVEAVRKRPGA
jgi:hypothetical protein